MLPYDTLLFGRIWPKIRTNAMPHCQGRRKTQLVLVVLTIGVWITHKTNRHCKFDFAMCHCRTMYRAAELVPMVNTNRPLDDVTSYASITYRSDHSITNRSEPEKRTSGIHANTQHLRELIPLISTYIYIWSSQQQQPPSICTSSLDCTRSQQYNLWCCHCLSLPRTCHRGCGAVSVYRTVL